MEKQIIGHVAFACGATTAAKEDPTPVCRQAKDGRIILCVFDSDSKTLSRPQTPQGPADCVHGCPCKRAAGRKQVSAWHEDGRGVGRVLVTCRGTWEPRGGAAE